MESIPTIAQLGVGEPAENIHWKSFLETIPPCQPRIVKDLFFSVERNIVAFVDVPALSLYCQSDACNGVRLFESDETNPPEVRQKWLKDWHPTFLHYRCRNCKTSKKTYAIMVK